MTENLDPDPWSKKGNLLLRIRLKVAQYWVRHCWRYIPDWKAERYFGTRSCETKNNTGRKWICTNLTAPVLRPCLLRCFPCCSAMRRIDLHMWHTTVCLRSISNNHLYNRCCGSGTGIRYPRSRAFWPEIRTEFGQDPDLGFRTQNQ